MGFASAYLNKHDQKRYNIPGAPSGLLRYIIIIPAYCEPDVEQTLLSIYNQKDISNHTEIFVVFNFSESDPLELKEQNRLKYKEVKAWISNHKKNHIAFYTLLADNLPAKYAGAGFARKIAMDIAINRFNAINNPFGFLLSLDADTTLPKNYLQEVDKYCQRNRTTKTLIFNFEHEIKGTKFSSRVYRAITLYELYLRYYRQMLEYIHFPYPYYTIGSCFGIRADLYCNVGGMSKRKAGEDFYFLHKVFPFEHIHFFKNIRLIPSSRPSWRVPFGTGPEVRKLISSPVQKLETYHPDSFEPLKVFLRNAPTWYDVDIKQIKKIVSQQSTCLHEFLNENNFLGKIQEIKNNSASPASFQKRLLGWFNAFFIIKYLNYAKEKCFPPIDIKKAVKMILKIEQDTSSEDLLMRLRAKDCGEISK